MSLNTPTPGSRALDWALAIGGSLGFVIGAVVFMKSQQPPIQRSFIFLVSVFVATTGIGQMLETSHPELSSRFKFTGKVFAGFALFSISWARSHP